MGASYKRGLQSRLRGRMLALLRVSWLNVLAVALALTVHPSALLHSSWIRLCSIVLILLPIWSAVGLAALLPVLILRKKQLTTRSTLHPRRLAALAALVSAPNTFQVCLAYIVSWAGLFAVWTQLCALTSPNPDFSPFLTSNASSFRTPQINPRVAYLACSTCTFTLLIALRHVAFQFSVLRFHHAQHRGTIGQRFMNSFGTRGRHTVVLSVSCSFAWPLLWLSLKNPILRTLIYPTPFR